MNSPFVGGKDYRPLSRESCMFFVQSQRNLVEKIGGSPVDWTVDEVGDGNLNLVFIVNGTKSGLVVKQALPYVRLVGESWPLPLDRAYFEYHALKIQTESAPQLVPKLYHFDTMLAATVMELLSPHIILRKGLIRGTRYPKLASDLAEFCALTLFKSSDLGSPALIKRERQAIFSQNITLSKITEDLVFTDPYRIVEMNRWTTPQLDSIATAFRTDAPLKVAVQELKYIFLTRGEALIHGDLHTGSIMVTETETRVIDPEFAIYGPMGFDLGAFMANLLLAFFSQEGHASSADDRIAYRAFILDTLVEFWTKFEARFVALWAEGGEGDAFLASLFQDEASRAALKTCQTGYMKSLLADALGFAGAKMVRRILGLAHAEDLESITDPDRRAICEKRALGMARDLILNRKKIESISTVRAMAEDASKGTIS